MGNYRPEIEVSIGMALRCEGHYVRAGLLGLHALKTENYKRIKAVYRHDFTMYELKGNLGTVTG